jgi:7,8-dihydro-6-hydroxymethylpterin-pyrophosphokinase
LNAAFRRDCLSAEDSEGKVLKPIEERLGRVRTADPYAPRTIDIDILIYDRIPIEEGLWEQAHLCLPLSELIPDFPHPIHGETLLAAAQRLMKSVSLKKRSGLIFA